MTDAAPPADANTPDPTPGANPPQQEGAVPGPGFRILAQYVRDLSFENPKAPESLRIEGKPAIDLGVEMNAQGRQDGLFEVDLRLTVKATGDIGAVFTVELLYGGLFALSGVAEQDIEPLLLIECPRYLFPFAREIIAGATSDGGFYPPFMLDPIDFASIYIQRQQQIASGPAETGQA
jgi:preprotein translocase subunit SecB